MADFLAENNACGQSILKLVARGNAIVTELLRLSDYVPSVFRLESKLDQQKYGDIICDFSYFQISEVFESKVENNSALQDVDEEFRENYGKIVERFYSAFQSIHQYVTDLNHFIQDLDQGIYIQQSLETVMVDPDGKQLMCEALYLYGVMLLTVDLNIDGVLRERILVSYYRYSGQRTTSSHSNVDDVCKLLRSTGFSAFPQPKRPPNYPEDFFLRTSLDETYVNMVIGSLRSDDIYHQITSFPYPEHRSTALGNQAGMLYVCLFFMPNILHNHTTKMREIVDKYFPDNWVTSMYMGRTVNLLLAWEPYKAAKQALANTISFTNLREMAERAGRDVVKYLPITEKLLMEGTLEETFVLDNTTKLMNVLRSCNSALRWILLHTSKSSSGFENQKRSKQAREQVLTDMKYSESDVIDLLINTAQLELKLKDMFKELLKQKQSKWENCKKESVERLDELAEVFSGTKPLNRVEKNEHLQSWFREIGKQVNSLDHQDPTAVGRKIVQLIQALEDVKEFHQVETSVQVREFVGDVRTFLHRMLRYVNVREEIVITMQVVGDLSYAWDIIEEHTSYMQSAIKEQPARVGKLRALFLKLSSALELPLLRINQAHSDDLVSVSAYYSNELVAYVRQVLQVIPQSMFALLDKIIAIQTSSLKELPTRLDKDKLREYSQLDHRFQVAKLTHGVSQLTEGVLGMQRTLVGIIQLDPHQLLEDGVRKQLVQQLAEAINKTLVFSTKAKESELTAKLKSLEKEMSGYRRSFEYIQDYVNIYGLKIWQEELTRIINYNLELESNNFLRQKVQEWESMYQSRTVPIPRFPPVDSLSVSFMGRLAREIIRITDPKSTVHIDQMSTWYDLKTHAEVLDISVFNIIHEALDTTGLTGLDKMFSFMIVKELQNFSTSLSSTAKDKNHEKLMSSLAKSLQPTTAAVGQCTKVYTNMITRTSKLWSSGLVDSLLRVGQLQLLRRLIGHQLNTASRFHSKHLYSALDSLNHSVVSDIKAHYKDPSKPYPADDNPLLYELSSYLEWIGMSNPLNKIYVTASAVPHFSLLTFCLLLCQMPKLIYVKSIGGLTCRRAGEPLDGLPLIIGILTLLKQFHSDYTTCFLEYVCQYISSYITQHAVGGSVKAGQELPGEGVIALAFLSDFTHYADISKKTLSAFLPPYTLSLLHTASQAK